MILLVDVYLNQGFLSQATDKLEIIQITVHLFLKLMAIIVKGRTLVFYNSKVLLQTSIRELFGLFIWNTMEASGTHQQMLGKNGNGKVDNLWTKDWVGLCRSYSFIRHIIWHFSHNLLLTLFFSSKQEPKVKGGDNS